MFDSIISSIRLWDTVGLCLINNYSTPTDNIYCSSSSRTAMISSSERVISSVIRDPLHRSTQPLFVRSAGFVCRLSLVKISCPVIGQTKLSCDWSE